MENYHGDNYYYVVNELNYDDAVACCKKNGYEPLVGKDLQKIDLEEIGKEGMKYMDAIMVFSYKKFWSLKRSYTQTRRGKREAFGGLVGGLVGGGRRQKSAPPPRVYKYTVTECFAAEQFYTENKKEDCKNQNYMACFEKVKKNIIK
ncbi:hypothetical protein Anas_06145 [Armadillidium nasatum]|uniref:Uncharacterized protein n=1 Tax=Armadillidium nasatum TaxID=96803 RepID=A0A5N5SQG7_9CRUS|nr:hypothetical protein Anas_06145 [Armadillidium nasatum]